MSGLSRSRGLARRVRGDPLSRPRAERGHALTRPPLLRRAKFLYASSARARPCAAGGRVGGEPCAAGAGGGVGVRAGSLRCVALRGLRVSVEPYRAHGRTARRGARNVAPVAGARIGIGELPPSSVQLRCWRSPSGRRPHRVRRHPSRI